MEATVNTNDTLQLPDGDFKFPFPYIMQITNLRYGDTDTQCALTEQEAIALAFAAARVAGLNKKDAYSISITEQATLKSEGKRLHFVSGKSQLLESMRQALR